MDELRWVSAAGQGRLLAAGDVTAEELRDRAIGTGEELAPAPGFLVEPLYERAPPGGPTLLEDAGQEIGGTPHDVGFLGA